MPPMRNVSIANKSGVATLVHCIQLGYLPYHEPCLELNETGAASGRSPVNSQEQGRWKYDEIAAELNRK